MIAITVAFVAALIMLAMHLSHQNDIEFIKHEARKALALRTIESYDHGHEDGQLEEQQLQREALEKVLFAEVA